MDSVYALRLSEAVNAAKRGGDFIDHGWSLVKELDARGFEISVKKGFETRPHPKGNSLNVLCGLVKS